MGLGRVGSREWDGIVFGDKVSSTSDSLPRWDAIGGWIVIQLRRVLLLLIH